MDNLKIQKAELDWHVKHNALVDVVEKVGGGSKRPPMD